MANPSMRLHYTDYTLNEVDPSYFNPGRARVKFRSVSRAKMYIFTVNLLIK